MHILLTDVLSCPRCGPAFGLIVIADELRERRIWQGRLGCANCRESYGIEQGFADLRFGTDGFVEPAPAAGDEQSDLREDAFRVAALLGVGEMAATVLLAGFPMKLAGEVARLLPAAQVAATAAPGAEPSPDINAVLHGVRLPFRNGSLRGVALRGAQAGEMLAEGARVLATGGRLVLDPAPEGTARRVAEHGLELLLEQDGVVVASLSSAG